MSLRLRLLLALVPLFVLGLVAANIGTYASLRSFLYSRVDEQLQSDLHQGVEAALLGADEGIPGGRPPDRFGTTVPNGTYGEIRTPSGNVVANHSFVAPGFTGPAPVPILPTALAAGSPANPTLITVAGTNGVSSYRVFVDTAINPPGDLLVVAIPLDDSNTTLSHLLLLEIAISGGVTLILAIAAWLIVRGSLRPLVRMGDTARSIAATGLGQRVEPATEKTEVGRLGIALNAMLEQIESAFAQRTASEARLRRFVSDASHELRTPLTSMRGYAELFRRNPRMERDEIALSMRRIEEEARRMGVLVDDLLLLARLDQGRRLERRPVDLEALVADACADARVVDPNRSVTAHVAAPLVVTGDDMRLRQVLGNLVRNALVHTPPTTPVEVVLRPEERSAVLEVIDHGRGIPPEEATRVFERFHRSDPGRSRDRGGSGLGLSIVAAVVQAHNGTVRIVDTPGGGATFRITLPRVPDLALADEPDPDDTDEGDAFEAADLVEDQVTEMVSPHGTVLAAPPELVPAAVPVDGPAPGG